MQTESKQELSQQRHRCFGLFFMLRIIPGNIHRHFDYDRPGPALTLWWGAIAVVSTYSPLDPLSKNKMKF